MKSIPLSHLHLPIWLLLPPSPCSVTVLSHDPTGPMAAVEETRVPRERRWLSSLWICHSACVQYLYHTLQNSCISPSRFHSVLFMHLLLLHQIARDHFIEKWNPANLIRNLAATSRLEAKFQLDEVLPKPEPSICFSGTICDTRTVQCVLAAQWAPSAKAARLNPNGLKGPEWAGWRCDFIVGGGGVGRGFLMINDATAPTRRGSPL